VAVRTATSVPTPGRLLADAVRSLRAAADPRRAAGAKAYFRKFEPVHLHGVAVPQARAIARALYARVRPAWRVDQAVRFADLAVRRREMETKWIGMFVLGRFHRDLPRDLDALVRRWILGGCCANWALIDALSAEVLWPYLQRHPARLRTVTGWSTSRDLWLRRAAVVPLVRSARRGEWLDEAYGVVERLMGDREDLIHKACGWLLREAGKTDPDRLERFLLRHGPHLPRTTVRYAIERFPPAHRARLLSGTRGRERE
jgi:3-methyladenine DNA glycosylase AlkD